MTLSEFYAELKGWQALVGSLLGFMALIGGALFNAHLNRKRDDRLRAIDANIIALSLYGEISLLRNDIASLANSIGGWYSRGGHSRNGLPDYFKELIILREPTLYRALSSKIGLLETELLLSVTKFYSDYESAVGHFPKLFNDERKGISYGVEWVLAPAIEAVEESDIAIQRIEAIGGISKPAIAPKIESAREGFILAESLLPDRE